MSFWTLALLHACWLLGSPQLAVDTVVCVSVCVCLYVCM